MLTRTRLVLAGQISVCFRVTGASIFAGWTVALPCPRILLTTVGQGWVALPGTPLAPTTLHWKTNAPLMRFVFRTTDKTGF